VSLPFCCSQGRAGVVFPPPPHPQLKKNVLEHFLKLSVALETSSSEGTSSYFISMLINGASWVTSGCFPCDGLTCPASRLPPHLILMVPQLFFSLSPSPDFTQLLKEALLSRYPYDVQLAQIPFSAQSEMNYPFPLMYCGISGPVFTLYLLHHPARPKDHLGIMSDLGFPRPVFLPPPVGLFHTGLSSFGAEGRSFLLPPAYEVEGDFPSIRCLGFSVGLFCHMSVKRYTFRSLPSKEIFEGFPQ